MFTIKVQVIRNTAQHADYLHDRFGNDHARKSTGSANCTQYLSSDGAIYIMNLFGAGGVSRLGGEIVGHNTTDARQVSVKVGCSPWG